MRPTVKNCEPKSSRLEVRSLTDFSSPSSSSRSATSIGGGGPSRSRAAPGRAATNRRPRSDHKRCRGLVERPTTHQLPTAAVPPARSVPSPSTLTSPHHSVGTAINQMPAYTHRLTLSIVARNLHGVTSVLVIWCPAAFCSGGGSGPFAGVRRSLPELNTEDLNASLTCAESSTGVLASS